MMNMLQVSLEASITSVAVVTTVAVAVMSIIWLCRKVFGDEKERGRSKIPRSWSFTSRAMALGSFPPQVNYPDSVINATLLFKECPTSKAVEEMVVIKMLEYERLATIPDPENGSSRPCPNLDPSKLIRHLVINGKDEVTYETIREHLHDPVSEGRGDLPWWEILIIENKGRGASACVLRVHHALADGLSLVTVVEHIITYTDGTPIEGLIPPRMSEKFRIRMPWWKLVWSSIMAAIHVLTLGTSAYDHDTTFSRSIHKDMTHNWQRVLVLFHEMPLGFVKDLKNKANVTINDILVTCLSQAIHDYLQQEKCDVLDSKRTTLQCRALIPVGFPRPSHVTSDKTETLRNKWCFVSASLGVGQQDIMSRLKFVSTHLSDIKNSPVAAVQLAIQNALPRVLPMSVNRQVVFDTFTRHSMVFSNMPGPDRPCAFAGKEVVGVQMFFSNLLPQVGFVSYGGKIFGNMVLDPEAIPNCLSLSPLFSRAFVQLANELGVDVPSSVREHSKREC